MKKIVNCFCENSQNGLGDFLRGSVHLHERLGYDNIMFNISVKEHPISKYLSTAMPEYYDHCDVEMIVSTEETDNMKDSYKEIDDYLSDLIKNTKNYQTKYISTNNHWMFKLSQNSIRPFLNELNLSEDYKNWFQQNLIFDRKIQKDSRVILQETVENENGKFVVIHFRLGDKKAFYRSENSFELGWMPDFEDCWYECTEILDNYIEDITIIVMSDSNELKKFIKERAEKEGLPIKILHTKSNHTQANPNKNIIKKLSIEDENLYYTVLDMKILTMAKKVYSYSVYFWGSGFVTWICKIFGIPIILKGFVDKERYLNGVDV